MFPRLCVCIIAIIVSTLVYVVTVTEAQDDSGASTSPVLQRQKTNYLHFAGKTYYFGTIFKANYFQATHYCRQQGMQLVHIDSQAENERLGKFAEEIGGTDFGYFWTSGTNLGEKKKWVWLSTGSNLVYFNWDRGEPNGRGPQGQPENCVEARYNNPKFPWNDVPCDYRLHFICETMEGCSVESK